MTRLHTRSEVAYTTIRKIFKDPYTDITLITLSKLAQALNVSTKDLIEDVPEEQSGVQDLRSNEERDAKETE